MAFRFCVLYFGLYIVLTQMLTSLLFVTTNDSGAFEVDMTSPAKAAITWVAAHVFHVVQPLVTAETGSGDRMYDWIELACIVALAAAGTLAWTLLDRKRLGYPRLFRWFHTRGPRRWHCGPTRRGVTAKFRRAVRPRGSKRRGPGRAGVPGTQPCRA